MPTEFIHGAMELGDFVGFDDDGHFFAPGGIEDFVIVDTHLRSKTIFGKGDQYHFSLFSCIKLASFFCVWTIRSDTFYRYPSFNSSTGVIFWKKMWQSIV